MTGSRKERGERVGGGFFVFRRGRTSGRIKLNPKTVFPFEHGTREGAEEQAEKLAAQQPGVRFCVFQEVATKKVKGTAE